MHLTTTPSRRVPAAHGALAIACLLTLRVLPANVLAHLPPCPIHQAFGILCPGCGGTRALLALLHGDLPAAWHLNPLLLSLTPLLVVYAIQTLRRGAPPRVPAPLTAALLLLTLSFTIARNL